VGRGAIARSAARALAAVLASGAAACSSIAPEVGPSQESCGVAALGATTTTTSGYGYGASSTARAIPTTCVADAGSACDDCESTWCCSTRLACYEDPVCACADHALDACTDAAGTDPSGNEACWSAFDATGTVEAARVACLTSWCQAACAIPSP
jgi:hypothetical protein